jgi:Protein of unknown function (DUF1566)
MKRIFAVWLVVLGGAANAAGGPVGNGDVNADVRIDVSDAVYLLSYLFLAGPALKPIECAPRRSGLPATGQSTCYDFVEGQGWVQLPCESSHGVGQDGAYRTGCPREGRFAEQVAGTVTDACTGLMWTRYSADVDGDGQPDAVPFCDALAYCENLELAGHRDWRLPNVRELQSIVDYGRSRPSIDSTFGAGEYFYWSSTADVSDPDRAYTVDFGVGMVATTARYKPGTSHFRAVRNTTAAEGNGARAASSPAGNGDGNGDGAIDVSDAVYLLAYLFLGGPQPTPIECSAAGGGLPATGQSSCYEVLDGPRYLEVPCENATCGGQDGSYQAGCPSKERFMDHGDGTVTDNCTGLMWMKQQVDLDGDGRVDHFGFFDALAYCENLSFAGHDDWRLPNVRELESIVDYGRSRPCIDPIFSAVDYYFFWSSTTNVDEPQLALAVEFDGGLVKSMPKISNIYLNLRAVRNAE